eukprot:4821100-Ditylum_brightwellii.AAC.1
MAFCATMAMIHHTNGFTTKSSTTAFSAPRNSLYTAIPAKSSPTALSSSVAKTSDILQGVRDQIAQDEEATMIMNALRGSNLNDDDAAVAGLDMRLVTFEGEGGLPYTYDPVILKDFFSKRPLAVFTRIAQVLSVGGGLAAKVALDVILGRNKNNPNLEVERARELKNTITSLGPFFI